MSINLRATVSKMSSTEWVRDGLKIMTPNGDPVARIAKWSKEQDEADAEGIVTLRNNADKLLDVVEAARATVGLMCKNGKHADGCKVCALSKALARLDEGAAP